MSFSIVQPPTEAAKKGLSKDRSAAAKKHDEAVAQVDEWLEEIDAQLEQNSKEVNTPSDRSIIR